jgi:hypothetical protein
MSLSNVEYAYLKKKSGLQHWGLSFQKNRLDFDEDETNDFQDAALDDEPDN